MQIPVTIEAQRNNPYGQDEDGELIHIGHGYGVVLLPSGRFRTTELYRLLVRSAAAAQATPAAVTVQLAHPVACPEHGPKSMRQSKYPGRPAYCAARKEGTASGYCRWQPQEVAA